MSKNINALVNALANFAPVKEASAATVADPTEQGSVEAPAADKLLTPVGPTGEGEAAKADGKEEVLAPIGAEAKTPAGEVPAAKPFEEGGKVANIDALRQKLAAMATPAVAAAEKPVTPAEVAPAVVKEDTAKEAAAQEAAAKEASAQTAPLSYHLVFNAMLKSASGRSAIEDAVAEIYGVEKAASLVKQSLAEQEAYEIEHTQRLLENLEKDKQAAAAKAEYDRQEAFYDNLMKSASTDEERQNIHNSFVLIKKAEEAFLGNEDLHESFTAGTILAEKVAMAMEADPAMMEDPGAIPEMAGPEGAPAPEEILAALTELVQSGQLTEEQAMAIAEQILGGGAMGGAPAGEEMPKAASAQEPSPFDLHLTKVASFVSTLVDAK